MPTRREFVKRAGGAVAAAAWAGPAALAAATGEDDVPAGDEAEARSRVVVIRREALAERGDAFAPKAVAAALDEAVRALTDESRAADAWARFFKPADRVGIKVNCLGLATHPVVARGLATAAGAAELAPERFILWDRSTRELRAAGYVPAEGGKGPRVLGTDALASRGHAGYAAEIATSGRIGSLYSRIVTDECTALVSAAVLKDHNLAGLTCGLKNFFGAIHNPNKYHENGCSPFIADVCAHEHIRRRLRLVVVDATRPQYHGGPPERARWQWPYGGLIVGTDPVAVDRAALKVLERKRRERKLPSLADEKRPVRYLEPAARHGLGAAALERIEVRSLGRAWLDVG